MTLDDIKQSYISTRGSFVHKNARRTIHNMDMLYKSYLKRSTKMTQVTPETKQSKIQEFADLLRQRDNAVQKKA